LKQLNITSGTGTNALDFSDSGSDSDDDSPPETLIMGEADARSVLEQEKLRLASKGVLAATGGSAKAREDIGLAELKD